MANAVETVVYPSHTIKEESANTKVPDTLRKRIARDLLQDLLAQLTTLHTSTAQHLAVLLLGHALAALLNHGTHWALPLLIIVYVQVSLDALKGIGALDNSSGGGRGYTPT